MRCGKKNSVKKKKEEEKTEKKILSSPGVEATIDQK